ncbi:MAG: glycosyltransferase family 2 protein [Acetobacteraceae bacterium]
MTVDGRRDVPVGSTMPRVAIVVINWNDADTTLRCLQSLRATDYANRTVIVVDNGSTDGSAARVAAAEPGIDLVINPENLGFTGGVNAGMRRAMETGADFVWLLNSDAVTAPDVLSRLVAAAETDPGIGLVSPVLHDLDHPDAPEICLARFDPDARIATQTADPTTAQRWLREHPQEVILVGTALLVRRALIETIGLLDPQFFAYVEDVDYSLRCHAAGFKAVAVPDAVVLHTFKQPVETPGAVPPYLHYFMTRNYLLLWRKLPPPVLRRKASLWFLRQRLAQIARMPDQPAAIEAVLSGLRDGVLGIGGPYQPERRAPWLLRWLLGRHPRFWLALLDGRLPFRPTRG